MNSLITAQIPPLVSTSRNRQVCWRLPNKFDASVELLENHFFQFLNILPDFIQTILFAYIDDRDIVINTVWFAAICTICCFFTGLVLSVASRRLQQNQHERAVRTRCQQLQQFYNQIELERATFERENQKLSDEIHEFKTTHRPDANEDMYELREELMRFQADLIAERTKHDSLEQKLHYKQNQIQKYEYEMQKQVQIVTQLNDELLRLQQQRTIADRQQSTDISCERWQKSQEIIAILKVEINELKQEKFAQSDQIQIIQHEQNQLNIDKNQLTLKLERLKSFLGQRDQLLERIRQEIYENTSKELEHLRSILPESNPADEQHRFRTTDDDIEKSSQYLRDLHHEIETKARRINELDFLVKEEKSRAKDIETKLKIILELRERDAHLHIRQLGETDTELRKAGTDKERAHILQTQLELKQRQLDEMEKVIAGEQTRFTDQCSKLQHETHEKWMEIKRLTRELDISRQECQGLRRQISKYSHNQRSSQETTIPQQHSEKNSQPSNELETTGSPSSPNAYSQENFKSIAHPGSSFVRPAFLPVSPLMTSFLMYSRYPMPIVRPLGTTTSTGSNGSLKWRNDDEQPNESVSSSKTDDEPRAIRKTTKPKKTRTSTVGVLQAAV